MQTLLALIFLVACGGSNSDSDSGSADASGVDGSLDSTTEDAQVDVDAVADAAVDRLVGPGDQEPPERGLEPGSGADDVFRHCWHLTSIFCAAHYTCCELEPVQRLGSDPAECTELLSAAFCEIYAERPDAIGPQDRETLEADLVQLAASADECSVPLSKIGVALGNLELGGDCSAEALNPDLLCVDRASCIDGVCTASPGVGTPCGPGIYRCELDAYCDVEDMCTTRTPGVDGADCEGFWECTSGSCDEGMCVADTSDTWCLGLDRTP